MAGLPPPPVPGPVAAGQICDPDNISTSDASTAAAHQLVCQLTDVTETVMMPAEFQNALKGDVILAPGGTSIISQLLRAMSPPQYHSHSGIMSKNFVEVTHCTASEDRLPDYTQGLAGAGGIQPDVLTYLWPGSVTQTIDAALNGETWIDPNGKKYSIAGFDAEAIGNTDNDQFVLTPPLVVKPDPESAATRAKLMTVADYARSHGGQVDANGNVVVAPKAHYRFYCYTKPEMALTYTAPADAGWAAGTIPAVCSSFVWYCMHQNGVHQETTNQYVTEGDLTPSAVAQGALVGPEMLDGLFFYTQDERATGGNILNGIFQQDVLDAEGWISEIPFISTAIASDITDQLLNTFAFDNAANGYGSNAWQTPGNANAVSPDNIRWWKAPPFGVLGYAEPLQFLDAHPEQYTVSRWKQVITWGSVSGKVTVNGQAVKNAYVKLYDGMDAYTDGNGAYKLQHVGIGSYNISAQVLYENYEYSTSKTVTLTASNANIVVDLALQPPSDIFRRLDILYTYNGQHSAWFESTQNVSIGPDQQSIPLSPGQVFNSLGIDCDNPGKYNVMYTVDATLAQDLSIEFSITQTQYDNDDQSSQNCQFGPYTFNVPMGGTVGGSMWLDHSSTTWDDGPATFSFTAKNSQDD
ncbi:MAG TPA: carboxypeptidase-like regulatory domain-containing protein [Candidatus Sulfotelmatobacter sp.]|nr:carboxypeptidase-like regulatory domain-containing protein [Candidatus Sulfotelmatobacter sp.]